MLHLRSERASGYKLPDINLPVAEKPQALDVQSLILPAILEETLRQINGEGIVLIKYDSNRSELLVNYGCGSWGSWGGCSIHPVGNIIHLVSSIGQMEIGSLSPVVIPASLRDQSPAAQNIAFTPLFFNGFNLGALWVGTQRKLSTSEMLRLGAMGEVIANIVYCLSRENQSAVTPLEIIQGLVELMNTWDSTTCQNAIRAVSWARATGRRLGLNETDIQNVGWAALLHDIGNVGIPKSMLRKPEKLSDEEWEVVKRHPDLGARILSDIRELEKVAATILAHHERYDGQGYPLGLSGHNIPLEARIVSLVDAYGAMTSERSYRRTFTHEEAIAEINTCSGSQFDPMVTQAFLDQFH